MSNGIYEGKRVVVTGCASGIGEQLAILLAERGAEVVGLDRDPTSVAVAEFHRVDLADSESILQAADAITGPIDVLFNVAGVTGPLGAKVIIGINLVGTRELTEALLPRMKPGAAIVMTASLAASKYLEPERRTWAQELLATTNRQEALAWCDAHLDELGTGYAVSKDALVWYTLHKTLALAARGIRINVIAPANTRTPILEAVIAVRGEDYLKSIPMPLDRMATAREQATVIAFLGSEDASYMSGQVVWVDGGYHAGLATGALENVTGLVGTAPPAK